VIRLENGEIKAFDLANDWAVAHNGQKCRGTDKYECVIERAALFDKVTNDDRRGDPSGITEEAE